MVRLNKSGAIEMSISTIVIIVIAVTMLVFGIIFVRGIMCSSINLTSDVSDNAEKEINKLFSASAGEMQCLGSNEPVDMISGEYNIVWCGINAEESKEYTLSVAEIVSDKLTDAEIEEWVVGEPGWTGTVAPNDDSVKKVLTLKIPEDADEQIITITINAAKDGKIFNTQKLDFVVETAGIIQSSFC